MSMHGILRRLRVWVLAALACTQANAVLRAAEEGAEPRETRRFLYVAEPGIRNYLEFGGHGLLVFDIDADYLFVKRIPTAGYDPEGRPLNVKGVCASAATGRIYISTLTSLIGMDLKSEELLWEKKYEGGCDRMAISPDGSHIYLPSLEQAHWHVVDGKDGAVLATLRPDSGAHNTVYGPDGREAYLAGLRSPLLRVADSATHTIVREIGPFGNMVRPFTVNGTQTRCYVNVNELLGFEVGDLRTGKVLHRVVVEGFEPGPVKRHGCPSHGIGLTPDESEIWLCDGHNQRLHIFDAKSEPPRLKESIALRDEPGWIAFRADGKHAWPSTGEIIDAATRKILRALEDEEGRPVMSEKMVEIHFRDGRPVWSGDQFALGRLR